MGKRGPKPMPKALRLLRHAAPRTRTAAVLASDSPTMPAGLSTDEQAAWSGLLTELSAVPGLVSRAERGVCELVARLEPMIRAAAIVVRAHGSTLTCLAKDGDVKFVQTRPEATFVLKTGALLKGLYAELGLSPSGRSRVSVTPAPAASKLDRFLGGQRGA